ncbi:MAG: UvrD-helicase domain-containing protein [Phycisphaerales bacterium]|nr:UvrD-helicase domain-containing protein [Phycisphaerales bacterium]
MPDPLLADLTEPQRQAVLHTEGPLLVLAAAGSGKTRVITRRIAHLVRTGAPPWSILALTFTNKAAGEMRERVASLLGEGAVARGLTVTTFHSLCARLLRRYAEAAGLGQIRGDFTIYDTADQTALVKKVLAALELSGTNWPPRSVLSAISAAKNDLMDAPAFAAHAGDFYSKTIARVYTQYQKALTAANAADFDDLLVLTARMLRERGDIRGECQGRWRYLLIDEYQDTNRAQFVIAGLLAGGAAGGTGFQPASTPNICVVGDPDQAIYGWRGASISNILDFESQYPGCRVIKLGENFRSTAPILSVADTLIRSNKIRKHKDLFTKRAGGQPVEVVLTADERQEARLVSDWLRALHAGSGLGKGAPGQEATGSGTAWKDMAVFYRTNSLSRVIEDELRASGIPYVIARGTAFYQREEIRNALAYLRVIANPADEVSLLRVANTPPRGIGDAGIQALEVHAARTNVRMLDAMRGAGDIPGISGRSRGGMTKFVAMIDAWTGAGTFMGAGITGSLADLAARVVKESGLEGMYQAQAKTSGSESDAERLENLNELISSAAEFELEYDAAAEPGPAHPEDAAPPLLSLLRAYLESISLVADADMTDPDQGVVTMMTLHAAKGLEFAAVAMVGLEEGLLPHSRARESDADLEEERRLCFVGITRAMRRLLVTSAKHRTNRGLLERTIPSRFLGEFGPGVLVSDRSEEGARHALADDGPGWSPSPARGPEAQYPIGSLVRHPQFGLGQVVAVTAGAAARADIRFRDVGVKTLILEYARLKRVDL